MSGAQRIETPQSALVDYPLKHDDADMVGVAFPEPGTHGVPMRAGCRTLPPSVIEATSNIHEPLAAELIARRSVGSDAPSLYSTSQVVGVAVSRPFGSR